MRETLRQLTLALALPIAVAAVWVVRSDSAGAPARESAIAYRAQLAEVPLPARERFRTPGSATKTHVGRVPLEAPTARHRRKVLPNPSAPPRVDLEVAADSVIEVAASPVPRTAQDLPHAAPSAPLPAPMGAPALVAAAPSTASHRPRSVPTSGASAVPAADSEVPAQSTTGSAPVKPPAETRTGKSVALEPAATALPRTSTPTRIAALEPELGLLKRDTAPVRGGAPVPLRDWAKLPSKLSPIVTAPVGIDEDRLEKFEKTNGRAPLTPRGVVADPPFVLSLRPAAREPSGQLIDLPLPPLEIAAAPRSADEKREISSPAPVFRWRDSPPMTILTIPEPGSALLLGAALAALGSARRRSRRA